MKVLLTTVLSVMLSLGIYGQSTTEKTPQLFTKNGFFVDINGKLFSGVVPEFAIDGEKIASHSYINGLRHGESIAYHDNGLLKELGNHQYDKKHGVWSQWNEKGILISKLSYLEGEKHGIGVLYHTNGKVNVKMNYVKGKKVGSWLWWDENGKPLKKVTY
ncbi:MAG: toxin-antitoxin system YwqK family antitoxin [Cyclobacteriaceae bacterium]